VSEGVLRARTLPLVERLEVRLDAPEVFLRLSNLPHVVFFDSAMRHPQLGCYSYVSADPIDWLIVPDGGLNAFETLKARIPSQTQHTRENLPPFQGGWAGLFGYELASSVEKVPAASINEFRIPPLAVGLYDVVIAFDHFEKSAYIISQGSPVTDAASRLEHAGGRLAHLKRILSGQATIRTTVDQQAFNPPRISELAPQFAASSRSALTSNFSADGYQKAVKRVIDYIFAGDVFQVNLSQRLLHPATASSIELYRRLRSRNPAPFSGYLDGGEWQVASASPERFLRLNNRHVETRPIKGTRGRSRHAVADLFTGDDLRASEKDRAENVMIVDLLRNDLSRSCMADSVRVSQLCGLETYEYVQHLVSVVEGTLRHDCTPLDALQMAFPGGSVTGAPKIRAMEIIAEVEPTVRGPYCGCLGYIGANGNMDSSILIRTITSARGWWQLPVGGGIVAQSVPHEEYEETWHKAAGLIKALTS